MSPEIHTQELQDCMTTCSDCANLCNQCAHHCLHMGVLHASPQHQGIMRDCADICALAAAFMARSSHHSPRICRACAQICSECADSCESLAKGDDMMTRCADHCRRCAAACENMAGESH